MVARRNDNPLEEQEQAVLMRWAALEKGKYPELELLVHIPNGGSRHKLEAANLKRCGVKAGFPDLMLPVARHGYHGLFIEMKRVGGEKPRASQLIWHENLVRQGYEVVVCYGWDDARKVLERYLR